MSNESTTPGPAERPRLRLPQFDPASQDTQIVPTAPAAQFADDTQTLSATATTSALPVTPPSTPYAYAGMPASEGAVPVAGPSVPLAATGLPHRAGPAASFGQRFGALFGGRETATAGTGVPVDSDGPRWSAKKTAVTAGLAIVLASAGAIGAAAAMPAGSNGGDSFRGPGGGRSFQFPGGNGQGGFGRQNQNGQQNQQLPNLQNGVPGGGLTGIDPNQLSQLDPQDLLNQLNQGIDPFSGGTGGSDGTDGSGSGQGTDSGTGTVTTT